MSHNSQSQNIDMGQPLNTEIDQNKNKIGKFCLLIHEHLNTIRTIQCTRQPNHEVHSNPFSLPHMSRYPLLLSTRPPIFGLHLVATLAISYKIISISLNTTLPRLLHKTMIILVTLRWLEYME